MDDLKEGDRVTVRLTGEPPFDGAERPATARRGTSSRTAPNFRAESTRASVGRKSPIRNNTVSRARGDAAGLFHKI